MVVVDSSALVAIGLKEPDDLRLLAVLGAEPAAIISPINYVETGIVLVRRGALDGQSHLDVWLSELGVLVQHDAELSQPALAAYLRYGKGVHPAGLNLADCFAYALARQFDAPLLYKGNDFGLTDVRSALQPT